MIRFPLKIGVKKSLGVDVGTSSIKIVELSGGRKKSLENYGEVKTQVLYQKPFRTFERGILFLSSQAIARAILAILEEAKIKTKKAIFSIPDFSSFFTNFTLPQMAQEELEAAIKYEARQHIPLPLSQVTLDWQIIQEESFEKEEKGVKILLVAVPNEIISQYQEIAALSKLELQALEAEVFGLLRSLVRDEKKVVLMVDIGARSTTCSVIDNKILKISHSFDTSGSELTASLARSLSIDYKTAKEIKQKYGLVPCPEFFPEDPLKLRKILLPLIDLILSEIEKISKTFSQKEGKKIEKLILAGGVALLPGLKEYFSHSLNLEVQYANPFLDLDFNPILEKTLEEMGPSFGVAVGMALRGLE